MVPHAAEDETHEPGGPNDRAPRRGCVLIVEDEIILALGLEATLRDLGFATCGIAATAGEAERLAGEANPDLVFMDIRLNGERDGIEAARAIRARLDVPIVFLTAHVDPGTRRRAEATRPAAFLSKPYSPEELKAVLDRAMAAGPSGDAA